MYSSTLRSTISPQLWWDDLDVSPVSWPEWKKSVYLYRQGSLSTQQFKEKKKEEEEQEENEKSFLMQDFGSLVSCPGQSRPAVYSNCKDIGDKVPS